MSQNTQRGSAIVLLLIAVALFAAVAYAFTQGSRTNTSMITDEQAKAYAQQIIDFANDVKMGVKRIQLRGYTDTQIAYDNTVYKLGDGTSLSYPNANCTSSACQIFNTAGGGVSPIALMGGTNVGIDGTVATGAGAAGGQVRLRSIGVMGVGTAAPELVLQVLSVSGAVCKKINTLLGIGPSADYIPPMDTFDSISYAGSYGTVTDYLGDTATILQGKTAFCALANGGNGYHFNAVMIAR